MSTPPTPPVASAPKRPYVMVPRALLEEAGRRLYVAGDDLYREQIEAHLSETRGPQQCPRCMNWCLYDGWDHTHAYGIGIGSCTSSLSAPTAQSRSVARRVAIQEGHDA